MNSYISGIKASMMQENKKFKTLNSSVNLTQDKEKADSFKEFSFGKTKVISSLCLDESLIVIEVNFRGTIVSSYFLIFEWPDVISMNGGEFKKFINYVIISQVDLYDSNSDNEDLKLAIDRTEINREKDDLYNEFREVIFNNRIKFTI